MRHRLGVLVLLTALVTAGLAGLGMQDTASVTHTSQPASASGRALLVEAHRHAALVRSTTAPASRSHKRAIPKAKHKIQHHPVVRPTHRPTHRATHHATPRPTFRSATGSPQAYALARVGATQFACLKALWNKESGWNVYANNPSSGAYGIPQSLPGSKMASAGSDWRTNGITQVKWGLGYIDSRYGSSCNAWNHSIRLGWY